VPGPFVPGPFVPRTISCFFFYSHHRAKKMFSKKKIFLKKKKKTQEKKNKKKWWVAQKDLAQRTWHKGYHKGKMARQSTYDLRLRTGCAGRDSNWQRLGEIQVNRHDKTFGMF
jgi:hypothetical protein